MMFFTNGTMNIKTQSMRDRSTQIASDICDLWYDTVASRLLARAETSRVVATDSGL